MMDNRDNNIDNLVNSYPEFLDTKYFTLGELPTGEQDIIVLHLNIRGLYNKLDDLKILFEN